MLLAALITGIGVASSEAATNHQILPSKAHTGSSIAAKSVTLRSEQGHVVSKPSRVCSVLQGVSYGAALVGLQSVLIVLPSFASGVGIPVAAIATGIGTTSSGIGFVTMVAHDVVCK